MVEEYHRTCKVVLVGETGVGKTCIISRYINDTFSINTESTTGASFACKIMNFEDFKKVIKFEIWDTAGQEKYRALSKIFYKDAAIAILVYDITREESFEELKQYWYQQLKTYGSSDTTNKADLLEHEKVSEEEARSFAQSIGAIFRPTSALNNSGIDELFKLLGVKFLDPTFCDESTLKDGKTKLKSNSSVKKNQGCC